MHVMFAIPHENEAKELNFPALSFTPLARRPAPVLIVRRGE